MQGFGTRLKRSPHYSESPHQHYHQYNTQMNAEQLSFKNSVNPLCTVVVIVVISD